MDDASSEGLPPAELTEFLRGIQLPQLDAILTDLGYDDVNDFQHMDDARIDMCREKLEERGVAFGHADRLCTAIKQRRDAQLETLREESKSHPPELTDVIPFHATAFEKCYHVHMAIFTACSLLTANLLNSIPRSCLSHPMGLIIPGMFLLFVGGAAIRWHYHVQLEAAPTRIDLAKQLISHARTNSWAMLLGFSAFGLFCNYAATQSGGDLCGGDDLFKEAMPAWFAHIGSIELLVGMACSTYGISLRVIAINGGAVHCAFAVCQLLLFLSHGTRSASVYATCHLVQYMSFGFGAYVGDALLNGQKYYFDKAAALSIQLLEKRVEQLAAEKERAEYDRRMAQHRLTTYDERKLSQAVEDDDSDDSWSCSDGRDALSSEDDPKPVQALEQLQPGVALSAEPSLPKPKGAAASNSGWTDISSLLKVSHHHQNEAAKDDQDEAARQAVRSQLSPTAPEWRAPSTQHAVQHMYQHQLASPATTVWHQSELGGVPRVRNLKTVQRREKRQRAAQRQMEMLERLVE